MSLLHPLECPLHRIGPLLAAFDHLDAQDRDVRAELHVEQFAILGRDADDHLLHIRAIHEPLGRMQPHGPAAQRRERLLVRFIVKASALTGGGQDDGERGHGIEDTECRIQRTGSSHCTLTGIVAISKIIKISKRGE